MKKIIYIVAFLGLSVLANAQVDRSKQPVPGPAPTINLSKPQSFVLSNGLTVLLVENHKLPSVSFSLVLDNPLTFEGDIKGVEDLTSAMMGNGTSLLSKDQFNKKIEYYGADIDFSINGVSGNMLSKYFNQVMPLVAQGALDPLFEEDEMNSERNKIIEALKEGDKSAQDIASRVRSKLVYGKNYPKGELITAESIGKVTLEDIKNCYKTNFIPTKAYLVIVGDVTLADVKKLVSANFSSWKKAPLPVSKYSDPQDVPKTEIDFVDVPNAVQSEIAVTNLVNLKMSSPDLFAALLANQILGSSDSRLFNNLRERHGWTYGAYSSIRASKYISTFAASASVRNAVTDSAVVEILHELDTIRTQLPTSAELDLAKAKYVGSYVMNAEKPAVVAQLALNEKTQNLPADFYENYIKNVNVVTLEQVREAAKKYFSRDNARIVVVGKASEVLPRLEKLALPIRYFDKDGNEVAKPEEKKADVGVTAQSVLSNYIQAIGGEKAIGTIKSLFVTTSATIQGTEMQIILKQTSSGKSSVDVNVMGTTFMKTVFDGAKGYVLMQGQKKILSGDDLDEARQDGNLFPEMDWLKSPNVKLSGIESVDGKDAYKITNGHRTAYYDVKTSLKVAEETNKTVQGKSATQRALLSDYRSVAGVLIPYKTIVNMMGMDIVQHVTDVKVNEGVSDSDFQ